MKTEMLMTFLTTILFLGMYWWSTLPDWKREMLLMELRKRVQIPVRDGLSLADRLVLEEFRREISRYEHARKRDDRMAPRDNPEEGN
jgi:hypothetical protein